MGDDGNGWPGVGGQSVSYWRGWRHFACSAILFFISSSLFSGNCSLWKGGGRRDGGEEGEQLAALIKAGERAASDYPDSVKRCLPPVGAAIPEPPALPSDNHGRTACHLRLRFYPALHRRLLLPVVGVGNAGFIAPLPYNPIPTATAGMATCELVPALRQTADSVVDIAFERC